MRSLYYTNYRSGNAGLSNAIMSIEIGVVLAHLTNRLLVLDGNVSPPANIVSYDSRVDNQRPSRVTDLIDLPVPWVEPEAVDISGLESLELTDRSLMDVALYFPQTLDLTSGDALAFARGRKQWLTVSGAHDSIPVLRLSEQPLISGTKEHRNNLGYYSYQFYFDNETRRSVYRILQRMQAKQPFAELAARVAKDLGRFNAVHLRRGDFKHTYGVTTLDRRPSEAIEAMDQVFDRNQPLVILTDERDDPFFGEILQAYPKHCFIDWHILDRYEAEFKQLPRTDSLALALLSQLVAAEAAEFIGTMTSTFTGLVQRLRGNRGRPEAFRFLWNELPDSGVGLERGRHAYSDCIALERGEMVEQFSGPYTWNRVSQLLNPAWMREWPESFLTPGVLATGALTDRPIEDSTVVTTPVLTASPSFQPGIYVTFERLQVAIRSHDASLLQRLAVDFATQPDTRPGNVIANFDVFVTAAGCWFTQRGLSEKTVCDKARLTSMLKRRVAALLVQARQGYCWLEASAFTRDGRGLVVAGDTSTPDNSLLPAMRKKGWELMDGELFAVRVKDLTLVPFGARARPEGAAAKAGRLPTPLASLVIAQHLPLHAREASLAQISPATAVAAMLGSSLEFKTGRHRAMLHLCSLLEQRPAARLRWNTAQDAAGLLTQWDDAVQVVAA